MPITLRNIKITPRQVWWCTAIITALIRLKQEDTCTFKSSLDSKEELSVRKRN